MSRNPKPKDAQGKEQPPKRANWEEIFAAADAAGFEDFLKDRDQGAWKISPAEQARRRDGLDSVIGTMTASGESIPADTMEIFEQYVRGEITFEERSIRVLALIGARQQETK